ncbi:MAG TPA: hypothetical protein VGI74_00590 [Streptosporangiaceae bacterium]
MGSPPSLDGAHLVGQARHIDDCHIPEDVEVNLEVTTHNPVAYGHDLVPWHLGVFRYEFI